jgi:hypothetical protein
MQSSFWRRLSASPQPSMSDSAGGAAGGASDIRRHTSSDLPCVRDPDAVDHQGRKELDAPSQLRTAAISSPRLVRAAVGLPVVATRSEQLAAGIVLIASAFEQVAEARCRTPLRASTRHERSVSRVRTVRAWRDTGRFTRR